jgi:very-short-patch-repair endonuclease
MEILERAGGIADRASLVALSSRAEVDRASRRGDVVRDGHGRYTLPVARPAAIALDVPGIDVRPQVEITGRGFSVRPDLVDVERRLVVEADSFAWHGDRSSLRWDSQRYNNLVVRGWLVLRFAWEDVMHDPAYVRRTLTAVAALVGRRTDSSAPGPPPSEHSRAKELGTSTYESSRPG